MVHITLNRYNVGIRLVKTIVSEGILYAVKRGNNFHLYNEV